MDRHVAGGGRTCTAKYGAIEVLHGVNFSVDRGEVVVILGANGAGKTTTLRAICQMVATGGSIMLDGKDLTKEATSDIVRHGVAHVPQGRGTLNDLSVEDNLLAGAYVRKDSEVADDIERWFDMFPRLRRAAHTGGRQPVRRRAADARRRPGADEPAQAAAARRAVARPGAR